MPLLPSSPATLTSTRTSRPRAGAWSRWRSRRPSTDSLPTQWMRSHEREDLPDLAALEVADEVPGEAVAVRARACAWRSCARFSPTRVTPGLGERGRGPRARRTSSRRRSRRRSGSAPRAARRRSPAIRSRARVGQAQPRDAPLAAGGAAVAAVGEEARVAHRARPASWTSATPASRSAPRATALRSIAAAAARLGDVRERLADLVADLVAAAARARARSPRGPARRAELAQRGDALLEDAGGEAAPAGVDHRDGARRAARATGRQSAVRTSAGDAADGSSRRRRPRGRAPSGGSVRRTTSRPWTCAQRPAMRRRRLAQARAVPSTARGSSSVRGRGSATRTALRDAAARVVKSTRASPRRAAR